MKPPPSIAPAAGPPRRRVRLARAASPLCLAALLVAAAAAYGCRSADPDVVAADPLAGATYVGDEACASCHADLYANYHRTGMGRAVSVFDPATAPERFGPDGRSPLVCHDATGYCYQAFVRGDTLFQRETRRDDAAYERLFAASHVVGSGNATRSYLMTVRADDDPPGAGYVTEMPLTWYVERAIWDLSPGYEQTNPRFERPISLECMTCHNGPPGFAEGTQNFYTDVPLGITCERCHGPGSAHAEARLEGDGPGGPDPTIVNPAHLAADLQLAVCQQCHLSGLTVYQPGHDPTTFRPGQPLDEHRFVFATEEQVDDPDAFGISSHALRMMRSACFEETRGQPNALTCTTCHDPHAPVAEAGPDVFNVACQSCHGAAAHEVACARPEAATPAEAATGDCVSCHMQRGGTSDIPHVSFTDHWIRRTLPEAPPREASVEAFRRERPFTLVDVTAREHVLVSRQEGPARGAAADLAAGMAYFLLYETNHRLPSYLPEVAARIRRGLAAGADHPEARTTLGRALLEMDSLAAAEAVLADAVARVPESAHAAYWLGAARVRRGMASAAVEPLRQAVALQPRFTEARLKLGEALAAAGRPAEAAAAYEEALRRDPERHAGGWNDLGFLYLQQGRAADARRALARAVALDPRSAPARTNLGALELGEGRLDAAAAQFEAALRADPAYVAAVGNLGVVYLRQGRRADARRQFERLLALNPGDRQAAAYLDQLR